MPYKVDFVNVSTVGLESSPHADALAGLRANEARYFKNKYDADFITQPAAKASKLIKYVAKVLKDDIQKADTIKQMVKDWVADDLRA